MGRLGVLDKYRRLRDRHLRRPGDHLPFHQHALVHGNLEFGTAGHRVDHPFLGKIGVANL